MTRPILEEINRVRIAPNIYKREIRIASLVSYEVLTKINLEEVNLGDLDRSQLFIVLDSRDLIVSNFQTWEKEAKAQDIVDDIIADLKLNADLGLPYIGTRVFPLEKHYSEILSVLK